MTMDSNSGNSTKHAGHNFKQNLQENNMNGLNHTTTNNWLKRPSLSFNFANLGSTLEHNSSLTDLLENTRSYKAPKFAAVLNNLLKQSEEREIALVDDGSHSNIENLLKRLNPTDVQYVVLSTRRTLFNDEAPVFNIRLHLAEGVIEIHTSMTVASKRHIKQLISNLLLPLFMEGFGDKIQVLSPDLKGFVSPWSIPECAEYLTLEAVLELGSYSGSMDDLETELEQLTLARFMGTLGVA